jgi:hypothetical protein
MDPGWVHQRGDGRHGGPAVSNIMIDYEKRLNIAFNITFESSAIIGCDFHAYWNGCVMTSNWSCTTPMLIFTTLQDMCDVSALFYVPQAQVIHVWKTDIGNRVRVGSNGQHCFSDPSAIDTVGELKYSARTKYNSAPAYHLCYNAK